MAGCGDPRLIERHGNDLMTPEVANVADGDGQIVSGLPLNIESLVHSVREFIPAVVNRKREQLRPIRNSCGVGQVDLRWIAGRRRLLCRPPRIGERAALRMGGGSDGTSRNEALVEGANIAANLRIDEWRSLIDAEGAAGDDPSGKARREIGEQLAAVVVQAPAGAYDDLVVEHPGAPCHTQARPEAPLSAGQRRIAGAFAGA